MRSWTRSSRIFTAVFCGLPAVLLWILTAAYTVELPFWDEWLLILSIDRIERTADASFLLTQRYGDHYKPAAELLLCAIAPWTGASVRIRTLLNAGTAVLACWVLWSIVLAGKWSIRERAAASICAAWILLSPAQYRNWLWGNQACVYLSLLTAMLGWRALLLETRALRRASRAVCWGVLSSYTFGAGLLYWPASLYLCWRRRDPRTAAVLACSALVVLGSYRMIPGPAPSPMGTPGVDGIVFVLGFLGSALGPGTAHVTAAVGLIYLGFELVRRRDPEATSDLFGVMGLYVLLCAAAAAVYRAGHVEAVHGLVGRYVTYSCLFWTSVVALLIRRVLDRSGIRRVSALCLLAVLLLLLARSGWRGALAMEDRSVRMTELRRMVLAGETSSERVRSEVNPDPELLERCLEIARRRGYSPYSA